MDNSKKVKEYYMKAQKIINETNGALLTFVEKEEDGKNQINTLVNSPNDVALILQMFRSNYEACKMALESLDDEDVKKYGADVILKTIIDTGELKNVHKMFLV